MTEGDALDLLRRGTLQIEGRLVVASNATFLGVVSLDGVAARCVYKPVRGERPLWDFPNGTLAARETASYELSVASGWDLVPPTVLRDGPLGRGMCQRWVETDADRELIDLVPAKDIAPGWLSVLVGEDEHGSAVALVHAADPQLQRMALFDAIANNADRKASHILPTRDGAVHGVDHGVCFHVEDKLRTVLWGWAGSEIPGPLLDTVHRLAVEIREGQLRTKLADLLSPGELRAADERLADLAHSGRFPQPSPGWPAIPWPVF